MATIDSMPVKECDACGVFYINIHKGCEVVKRPGVPQGIPGHDPDITVMRTGGYRAECSCGWHEDFTLRNAASVVLKNHIWTRRARKEGKR